MTSKTGEIVSKRKEEKKLIAVCGLYCKTCTAYIATHEDPERLTMLANYFNMDEEEIKCNGCRSDKRGPYCSVCKMFSCAWEKGHEFCHECNEYPCEDITRFQSEAPHRNDLWLDNNRMKEVGCANWIGEMETKYSCKSCGTINSAYDISCRKCGNEPGNEFVEKYKLQLKEALKRLTK